jgi:2-polyprenyl-3-methyl-5-hydroxy-6-metoxy-1,4-benzoquinol methylase
MGSLINIYKKWEMQRDNGFMQLLEKNTEAKVVDLGCGKGDFTIRVKDSINCKEIRGADQWEEGIKTCQSKGIIMERMDFNKKFPFPDESFDVVVCNQVIEHLFYPSDFVKEICRIVKKGGYAVVSTENLASWDNIGCLLFGYTPFSVQFDQIKVGNRFSPHDTEIVADIQSHVRIFSYQGLIDIFKLNGFTVEAIKGAGYLPLNFLANVDKKHARFTTVKVRKQKSS